MNRCPATAEARRCRSAAITPAYADPGLRRKISIATKAGMAAKAECEFAALRGAWETAPAVVRRRFLMQLDDPLERP